MSTGLGSLMRVIRQVSWKGYHPGSGGGAEFSHDQVQEESADRKDVGFATGSLESDPEGSVAVVARLLAKDEEEARAKALQAARQVAGKRRPLAKALQPKFPVQLQPQAAAAMPWTAGGQPTSGRVRGGAHLWMQKKSTGPLPTSCRHQASE